MSTSGSPLNVESNLAGKKKKLIKEELPTTAGRNGDAKAEAEAMGRDDLENQARQKHHLRKEKVKDTFAKAFVCGFWLLFGLTCVVIISWVCHSVLPHRCHWLDNEQLDQLAQIMRIAFGAVGGSIVTYSRKFEKS